MSAPAQKNPLECFIGTETRWPDETFEGINNDVGELSPALLLIFGLLSLGSLFGTLSFALGGFGFVLV